MFFRTLAFLGVICMLSSCGSLYEKALRSTDKELIYEAAEAEMKKEKWGKAVTLYDYGSPYFVNSEYADDVTFNSAYANFKSKFYDLAARQFKNFYDNFLEADPAKREEALFLSGHSFYLGSPPYKLDQSSTYDAINRLQFFLEKYPDATRTEEVNDLIKELRQKLEKKYFEISLQYYKIFSYRAAISSFSNFLEDYPDTYLKEDSYHYLCLSRFELATQSIEAKKRTRLKEAQIEVENFLKKFPDSEFTAEIGRLKKRIATELKELDTNF